MKQLAIIGPALQLGWVVVTTTLIPLGIGFWLDHRLGTAPLFVLIGASVGIIAGTVGTVRVGLRALQAFGQPPEHDAAGTDEPVKEKEDRT